MTKIRLLKILIILLMVLILALGLFMIIGPMYDSYQTQKQISLDISVFKELVEETMPISIPDDTGTESTLSESDNDLPIGKEIYLPALREAMEDYNYDIYANGQAALVDAWSYQSEIFNLEEYGYPEEVIGLVSIPKINVEMPLYLGASYANLAKGFAQLSQTSMPIGGINTNCVIAGHRGYRGAAHLRDVEGLEIGDSVYIQNPWEILEYHVVSIKIIKPNETENIMIQPGRDLVTLITCHPYGVGSHRYVVTCERYDPSSLDRIIKVPESEKPGNLIQQWKQILSWRQKVVYSTDLSNFESSAERIVAAQILPWLCLVIILLVFSASIVALVIYSKRQKKIK